MINIFKGGGIWNNKAEQVIDMGYLEYLIKNNPEKEQILLLRSLPYGSTPYEDAKKKISYITPHGTFKGVRDNVLIKEMSGYLYFDIDQKDILCNPETYKQTILKNHGDKICMMGKSVGGQGLFFYVKVKRGLTADNFMNVWEYFKAEVFSDIIIDPRAKCLNRAQFITYDADLYVDHSVDSDIPVYLFSKSVSNKLIKSKASNDNGNKGMSRCIKEKKEERYTPTHTLFTDYKVLCSKYDWETKIHFEENEAYIIKEIDYVRVPILPIIKNGNRHNMFKIMVNCLVKINPDITLHDLQSAINFHNMHQTVEPLAKKDMMQTVEREYIRLKEGGINIAREKKKTVHTNPLLNNRKQIANKLIGKVKTARSKQIIIDAMEALKHEGKAITQKNVADLNGVSISTVKKYWSALATQRQALNVELVKQSTMDLIPNTDSINNTQNETTMEQGKVINMYKVQRTPEQEAAFQKTVAYNQYRIDHAAELLNIFELNKREFDTRFEKEYAEQQLSLQKTKSL